MDRTRRRASGAAPTTSTASSRARRPPSCRSSIPRAWSSASTPGPPTFSAWPCRRRCSSRPRASCARHVLCTQQSGKGARMAYIVAGLSKDAHQARGLIRALANAGFPREEIDLSGGPVVGLTALGMPETEAHVFAEGVRRGGAIIAVAADDEFEAEQAALLMSQHGAVDVESCDAGWRRLGWSGRLSAPEDRVTIERYPYVFGEYPGGSGRIYPDPRTITPSVRTTLAPYRGPE